MPEITTGGIVARVRVTADYSRDATPLNIPGRAGRTGEVLTIRAGWRWEPGRDWMRDGVDIEVADRLKSGELGTPYGQRIWLYETKLDSPLAKAIEALRPAPITIQEA